MNSGIYTSYSGLRAQMESLEMLANNLANVNTTGFKEQRAFYRLMNRDVGAGPGHMLDAVVNNHAVLAETALDLSNGSLMQTGRELDLALVGDGFLVVQTPNGLRLSRNGGLFKDPRSQLVTADGFPVLGEKGPILLGGGAVEITEKGDVLVDKSPVDRLRLVTVPDAIYLTREGNSLLVPPQAAPDPLPARDASVRQGYLEQSNVNPMLSTVRMIEIMRHFEAIQKSMNLISNVMDAKSIEKLSR